MTEKIYGLTESDAARVKKTVQKSEQQRPPKQWRNTPILSGDGDQFFEDYIFPWTGPFAVSIIEDENTGEKKLFVRGGYVTGNGVFSGMVADSELELKTGYVAVKLTLSSAGVWSTPHFIVVDALDSTLFPVALIELDVDGEYLIHQGRVLFAQFIISKNCPLARL